MLFLIFFFHVYLLLLLLLLFLQNLLFNSNQLFINQLMDLIASMFDFRRFGVSFSVHTLALFLHAISLIWMWLLIRTRRWNITISILLWHHTHWTGSDHQLWLWQNDWLLFCLFTVFLSLCIACF